MASKKETFITEIENAFKNIDDFTLSDDALTYFEALKVTTDKEKPTFTENGKLVLRYMQENKEDYSNLFQSKRIGEGLGISSKTASGAMRKLVTDGYVEKVGDSPVCYSLTDKGISANLDI